MSTVGGGVCWNRRRGAPLFAAFALALAAGAPPASAQDRGRAAAATPARDDDAHGHVEAQLHPHEPVAEDPALDWATLIRTTLETYPRHRELAARAVEAQAWRRRGRSWLAAAPSLYFSYLSDGPRDDFGQREYQGGVELPLWRAGQRGAVRAMAASASAESAAAAAALRLEVVGLLRGSLWDIAAAVNGVAAAQGAAAVARELVRVVERRHERGDLPRADVLLARTTLLEREQAVLAAQAELLDAERGYKSLTDLERRPSAFGETRTELDALTPAHPLIALADAEVVRASAGVALAERGAHGPVVLTLGPNREYDAFGGDLPRDSVAVALKVPIAGKAHGATQTAQAARAVAAAEAERAALVRRLDLDLHEAEHTLSVLTTSTALAAERDALAAERLSMAQTAFAAGEIELFDLLRAQETTLAARREVERLAIERQRTIAALNQALGVTP